MIPFMPLHISRANIFKCLAFRQKKKQQNKTKKHPEKPLTISILNESSQSLS